MVHAHEGRSGLDLKYWVACGPVVDMEQSVLAAVSIRHTYRFAISARMIDIPCGCGKPLEELCGEDCDGWAVDVELENELAWFRTVCSMLPVGRIYISKTLTSDPQTD